MGDTIEISDDELGAVERWLRHALQWGTIGMLRYDGEGVDKTYVNAHLERLIQLRESRRPPPSHSHFEAAKVLSAKYEACGLNADWSSSAWWVGPAMSPNPIHPYNGPNRVAGDVYIVDDEEADSDEPRYFVFRQWHGASGNPSAGELESYNDQASAEARKRLNSAGQTDVWDVDNSYAEDVDCLGSMPVYQAIEVAEEMAKRVIANRKAIMALEEFARQAFQLAVRHNGVLSPSEEIFPPDGRIKAEIRRLMGA